MIEEGKSHLFESPFRTRKLGWGTCLGSATMYGIVGKTGGQIDVTSAPGRGATLSICFTRVGEEEEVWALLDE